MPRGTPRRSATALLFLGGALTLAACGRTGGPGRTTSPDRGASLDAGFLQQRAQELDHQALAGAVRRFQSRHGIDADGTVGPGTLEQLNTPVENRIGQVRANLERIRWVLRDIPEDFLIVDIAGYRVHIFVGGEEIWAATARGGFPYMVRQEPGPLNSLGQVKFLLPNPYMVYLDDTPSKAKSGRTERAFSHGCIRTQNPPDLAALILEDQGWNRQRIDRVIASRKTMRVRLERPLPVLLLYWTAEVGSDGTVMFRKDLYGRDARIIEGLKTPLAVQPPLPCAPVRERLRATTLARTVTT